MITSFHQACSLTLKNCPNIWAQSYAKSGLTMNKKENQQAQAYYILSNISNWREGKEVRAFLNLFIKE